MKTKEFVDGMDHDDFVDMLKGMLQGIGGENANVTIMEIDADGNTMIFDPFKQPPYEPKLDDFVEADIVDVDFPEDEDFSYDKEAIFDLLHAAKTLRDLIDTSMLNDVGFSAYQHADMLIDFYSSDDLSCEGGIG